jgi:hypothetical protein
VLEGHRGRCGGRGAGDGGASASVLLNP